MQVCPKCGQPAGMLFDVEGLGRCCVVCAGKEVKRRKAAVRTGQN